LKCRDVFVVVTSDQRMVTMVYLMWG
jgi:hypothetical protein